MTLDLYNIVVVVDEKLYDIVVVVVVVNKLGSIPHVATSKAL
jgi:hypothetical protein